MDDQGCPDFDLAPLTGFPPSVFGRQRNAADGLIVVLALVFNDLKDLMWHIHQLNKGQPEFTSVNAVAGQWTGMRLGTTRAAIRLVNELADAVKASARDGALADPVFQLALAAVSPGTRARWQEIVDFAESPRSAGARNFVMRVRHTVAAHYDWKHLLKGYQTFFFAREYARYNEWAYASLGERIRDSRFYFADAAAQASVQEVGESPDEAIREVQVYLDAAGRALRNIVEAYLWLKAKDAGPVLNPPDDVDTGSSSGP